MTLEKEYQELQDAATALVDKLMEIHADPEYQSVWAINQIHAGPYTGPKYDDELKCLMDALGIVGNC